MNKLKVWYWDNKNKYLSVFIKLSFQCIVSGVIIVLEYMIELLFWEYFE